MKRRLRRTQTRYFLRYAVVGLLILVLIPALPWLGVALFFDGDALRQRIEAQVEGATGRRLSLGRVTLLRSLPPTVAAEEVMLANMPGATRPDMLKIRYAEAELGMVPLLFGRLEIRRLLMSRPELALEADPSGAGTWPADIARLLATPGEAPGASRRRARRQAARSRAIDALWVREGRLTWRDSDGAWSWVEIRRLDVAADREGMTATAVVGTAWRTVSLAARTGPLARLRDAAAVTPWPVDLAVETAGARLGLAGTLTRPLQGRGYALVVDGAAQNLADLEELAGIRLPPVRRLAFQARFADGGGRFPDVTGLSLRASGSDLGDWVPGLLLEQVDIAADSLDQPVQATLSGSFANQPLRLAVGLGAPAALLSPGRAPGRFAVDVGAEAAGARLALRGEIAEPEAGRGLALEAAAQVPDLAALSPLLGRSLPALRDLTLALRATDGEGGFARGIALRDIVLQGDGLELAGEASVGFGGKPHVAATLRGRGTGRDGLRGLATAILPAPSTGATGRSGWMIPHERLPLAALAWLDADLRLAVADLGVSGLGLADLDATAVLREGRLTLDPVRVRLPGGEAALRLVVNGQGVVPSMTLALAASSLPARPVLALLGLPGDVSGRVDLAADLRGAGSSWREIASRLGGRAGLAMTDAEFDGRLVEGAVGGVMQAARMPRSATAPEGASVRARCVALRLDAEGGMVMLRPLLVDARDWLLLGEGTVRLADERLAVRLQPVVRGGSGKVAPMPVRVGGMLARTTVYADQGAVVSAGWAGALPLAADPCPAAIEAVRAIRPSGLPGLRPPG